MRPLMLAWLPTSDMPGSSRSSPSVTSILKISVVEHFSILAIAPKCLYLVNYT